MSLQPHAVIMPFVQLVLGHDWPRIEKVDRPGEKVLLELVKAAGFEPVDVLPGKLRGNYLDQDSRPTGDTFAVNSLCSYRVIDGRGEPDHFATGWLDCAVKRVHFGRINRDEDENELYDAVCAEVERSVPLEPVQLGQRIVLLEYPPLPLLIDPKYFVNHTRNESELSGCVGVHAGCRGWMDRKTLTSAEDQIICRVCKQFVRFPKQVQTYGELRRCRA